MSEPLTREQEPVGCPSCHAVRATWITDCENPIHIQQANAYIHCLEDERAALREQLAQVTQEHDDLQATKDTIVKWLVEQLDKRKP